MKLIQQLRPYTTRVSAIKIPPKGVFILSFSEFEDTALETIWTNIFTGVFYSYIPIHNCNIKVSTNLLQNLRDKFKEKTIYISKSILTKSRSLVVDITPILNILKQRGYKLPYQQKFISFMNKCLQSFDSAVLSHDYRYIYDIIDTSKLSNFSLSDLKKLKLYAILKQLKEDDAFKQWFDDTYGKILLTIKPLASDPINVLVYDADRANANNPDTVIPKIINLIKGYISNSDIEKVADQKAKKVSALIQKIHTLTPKEKDILQRDLSIYKDKYADELANTKIETTDDALYISAKAAKSVVTNDSDVAKQEASQIIKELTSIQIAPPDIPSKLTDDDKLSKIRKKASPPQVGNISEVRKKAFQHLEDFIKMFNTYFERLKFRIISVDKEPVESRDITKTVQDKLVIQIEDLEAHKIHTVELLIPKVIDDNYFEIYGVKRVLIHQLFPLPVVSYKPGEVVIRTNFASATITLETRFKHKSFYAVILGKKVPAILPLIVYYGSLSNLLSALEISYKLEDETNDKEAIQLGNGQYLIVTDKAPEKKLLIQGLKIFKKLPSSDTLDAWLEVFQEYTTVRFIKVLQDYLERFIDPLTYYILVTENLPETVGSLFWYACLLAYSGVVTSQTDLRYRRIRSVEVLAVLIYKRLFFELYNYRLRSELALGQVKKQKLIIPKDALLKDLVLTDASSQYQQVNAINPLVEASYVTRVTYAGYGGIKSENVPMSMRNIDPTYFGTICPVDSPECLHPDTIVYKVSNVGIEKVRIIDIKPGDFILSHKGFVKVKQKWLTYKNAYRLVLEDGTSIICSEDHRFPVNDKQLKQVKDIMVEEELSVAER